MHRVALALLLPLALPAAPPFAWKNVDNSRWELSENGKPVMAYIAAPILSNNAPPDRERCCYVFPAFTPAGVNPLDDFPKDHFHHHGLFWAWRVFETGGVKYDLWMYRGVRHVAGSIEETSATAKAALLRATNFWTAGDKRIVREQVSIAALPAKGSSRTLGFTLTLEALDQPVTIRGSQERGKSYGGFSARFAPREETVIRTDKGVLPKDDDLTPYEWAELEAAYQGKRAALRITPDPANTLAPYQWCLRNYGFVGASFPGRSEKAQEFTLQPGKPVTLRFTVTLSDLP